MVKLTPLQCAEIAAAKHGFYDIDVKDNDPGRYAIVATAPLRVVTAKGETMELAVEKLLEMFYG